MLDFIGIGNAKFRKPFGTNIQTHNQIAKLLRKKFEIASKKNILVHEKNTIELIIRSEITFVAQYKLYLRDLPQQSVSVRFKSMTNKNRLLFLDVRK